MKTFSEWLQANGYDETKLTDRDRKHLELAWKAECQPQAAAEDEKKKAEQARRAAEKEEKPGDAASSFNEKMRVIADENKRQEGIRDVAIRYAEANKGNEAKRGQIEELCEAAVGDERVSVKDFQLQMLRFDRMGGPMVLTPREQPMSGGVLEAALCQAGGLESLEKHYDARTLEQAHKQFRGGVSIGSAITVCARQHGYRGHDFKSNWYQALRAAMSGHGGGDGAELNPYAAVTGPSTLSLPNVFSAVANKFMRAGFEGVDDTWRRISARRSVNDFKTATTVSLTGGLLYKKVPPSGEIKHGTLGETVYTNKVDTYAVLLGIDRQSLINDDTGALTAVSRRIGRGGALKLNDVFWTVFLNNSAFFTAGNNNVEATAGALSLTTLGAADRIFRTQTDPDGLPLGATPRILLVPPGNRINALTFMSSTMVAGGSTTLPAANILAGAYQVESSPYMSNSAYTGFSTTASYLLASPDDVPVIEVGFLNGVETPTVETESMEFNMLGMAWRGYLDFGVSLQEFRGGTRIAGA